MAQFYKYMSREAATATLQNRTLRWSTPPTLNDPFDMQFAFQVDLDRDVVRAKALSKSWLAVHKKGSEKPLNELGRAIQQNRAGLSNLSKKEFDEEIGRVIDETFDNMRAKVIEFSTTITDHFKGDKILCLCELPNSILMWAYYTQNHSGVVLRFTDGTPNNPLTQARPVRYVQTMPSLFDNELLSDLLAGYSVLDPERLINEVTLTKSSIWAHEREWRVYSGRGRSDRPYEDLPFNAQELDGVIFGVRVSDDYRTALSQLVRKKYPHAQLLQTRTETVTHSLVFDRI